MRNSQKKKKTKPNENIKLDLKTELTNARII